MGKVVCGMSMSVDGFINDRDGSVAALYPDFQEMHDSASMQESMTATGAVVMGRQSFAMGDPDDYAETYEFQVPIFVLTHEPPAQHPRENDRLTFTFVTDGIASAIAQAKAAAGDKDVTVIGGASTINQCLDAGLVDELHIDILPVLLGAGQRLFDSLPEPVALEKISVTEQGVRTSFIFRVVK